MDGLDKTNNINSDDITPVLGLESLLTESGHSKTPDTVDNDGIKLSSPESPDSELQHSDVDISDLDSETESESSDHSGTVVGNKPSTSAKAKGIEKNDEPPKKRAREESYIHSSDDRSSFLDEFDSDEYTFSPPEDSAEHKLSVEQKKVVELKKKLKVAEARISTCRCYPELTQTSLVVPRPSSSQVPGQPNNPSVPAPVQPPSDMMASYQTELVQVEQIQRNVVRLQEAIDELNTYQNELEVASVSDNSENPIENSDSSSASDENIRQRDASPETKVSENRSGINDDMDNMADGEEQSNNCDSDVESRRTNSSRKLNSSDSELSDTDKWICLQCNSKSLPHFRYCRRCFKIRRNWLPKRPMSKRLKQRKSAEYRLKNFPLEDQVDGPSKSRPSIVAEPQSSVDLNQAFLVDELNPGLARLDSSDPPGIVTLNLLTPPNSQEEVNKMDMCTMCCMREKNAAFVHNKIAHRVACYTCSDKILRKDGKCPICRERVLRVVKILS